MDVNSRRVLVVEDERDIARLLALQLEVIVCGVAAGSIKRGLKCHCTEPLEPLLRGNPGVGDIRVSDSRPLTRVTRHICAIRKERTYGQSCAVRTFAGEARQGRGGGGVPR